MPDFRVTDIYDIDAIKQQHDQFISFLTDSKNAILDLNNQRVTLKSADVSTYSQASQDLNKNIDASTTATTKATAANKELTKAQIEARLATQQKNAALKDEVLNSQAALGSYNQLQLQLKSLTAQYKALSAEERAGQTGQQLAQNIANTNAQLKILDAGLGNFQRNVGNYNNSLGILSKGVRGLGGIGVILSKALGIDPEIAIGIQEAGRAIRDIQHARELEEVGLKGETELYEQQHAKIEANVAALDGESVAVQTDTVAQAELATSLEASTVAQTGLAVETVAAGTALEVEAGAAETAAVATTGFSTALIATGIGAAIIAIIAAIVELVKVVEDYNAGLKSQYESTEALKTVMGELASATKEYETIRTNAAQQEIKDLQQQIDLRKASGVSSLEALALDKQLATQQLANANEEAQRYNINKETLAQTLKGSRESTYALVGEEQLKQEFLKKTSEAKDKNYERDLKAFDDNIAQYKKEADAAKAVFELTNEIFQKQAEAQNKIDLITTQTAKLNADERRALILAEAEAEASIQENKNAIILADERTTLNERLAAIKSNAAQQLSVIQATLQNTLNDPTKNKDKNLTDLARTKAAADQIKVNDNLNKQSFDANEAERKRDLKAESDYNIAIFTGQKEAAQNRITDRYTDLQQNSDALEAENRAEYDILTRNFELTKSTKVLNDDELLALTESYNNAVLQNNETTLQKEVALEQKAVTDRVAAIKYLQDQKIAGRTDRSSSSTSDQETQLTNDAVLKEADKFGKKRLEIEKKYQDQLNLIQKQGELDRLKIQEDALKTEQIKTFLAGENTDAIDAKVSENALKQAEINKGISDDQNKIDEAKRKKDAENSIFAINLAENVSSTITDLVDEQYQKELDNIERVRAAEENRYNLQKEAIQNSTLSQQEKTAQTIALDKKEAENKRKLDIQEAQLKLKQAKFDRDADILKITGAAIVAEFENGFPIDPAGIAIAVAAAGQIAVLASKPLPVIPAYALGTDYHKQTGPALIGEAGLEQVTLPSGQSYFVDKPTVHELPIGTKVKPIDSDYMNMAIMNGMMVQTARKIEEDHSKEIIAAIEEGSIRTVQAMKKQKGAVVNVSVNTSWLTHINKSVRE